MKYLLFDTETTNLIKNRELDLDKQPRIIEFFGHIIEDGKVIEELEFMCDPGVPVDEVITRITGINQSDVVGLPKFNHFLGDVCGIISRADAAVAHNLSYDFDVVNFEFQRHGDVGMIPWPIARICTVQETEWIKGHRLSLSALHEHLFGEAFSGAHRARVDVDALTRCFLELMKRGDL